MFSWVQYEFFLNSHFGIQSTKRNLFVICKSWFLVLKQKESRTEHLWLKRCSFKYLSLLLYTFGQGRILINVVSDRKRCKKNVILSYIFHIFPKITDGCFCPSPQTPRSQVLKDETSADEWKQLKKLTELKREHMWREARAERHKRTQHKKSYTQTQPTTHRDSYGDTGVSCPIKYTSWYETRHRHSMQTETLKKRRAEM